MNVRDKNILTHILAYCDQISEATARFGRDQAVFAKDQVYQNAVAMCLMQIGELSGHLSDDFRSSHPSQPWRQIKSLRNIIAHNYGAVDAETAWEIVETDIPSLRAFCESVLSSE